MEKVAELGVGEGGAGGEAESGALVTGGPIQHCCDGMDNGEVLCAEYS